MSFGGGGFGGFGSSNNQSTFGGFGSNTNANTGFGSNTNTTGSTMFGQSNNTFGGSTGFGGNNASSSPFGGGGFGSKPTTSFGSQPFGTNTSGGGLFGGGSTSSAPSFGGFGSTATNTSTGFGSGGTSGGLFGQNKTGFGGSSTGNTLFGGGSTSGFGSNTTSGFGGTNTGGFGSSTQAAPNNGTASTPFNAFTEKDSTGQQQYQTITFQQPYLHYSLEELRLVDYNQGRRYGNSNGQGGAFGQSTGFGGFGSTNTSTGFGSNTNTSGGIFANTGNTGSGFGQSNTSGFGSNTGGGLFGQNKPAGGLFSSTATSQPSSGGLFGSSTTNTGGFGSGTTGGTGFGSSTTGGLFGNQNQAKPAFGGFGSTTNASNTGPNLFGGSTTGGFGQSGSTSSGLFGQQNQSSSAPAFGSSQQTAGTSGGLFGGGSSTFGQNQQNQNQQNQNQNQQSGGLFSGFGQSNQNQQKPGGLFGGSTTGTGGGLFGSSNQNQPSGGLFGNTSNQNQTGGLFGNKPATTGGGLFGSNTGTSQTSTGGGLFGNLGTQNTQQTSGSSLFGGQQTQPKSGGLFGSSATTNTGGGLFGNLGQSTSNASNLGGPTLFSSQNQQQSQQSSLNNSLFGASGGSLLQTSMNTNPYGNDALFAGLATPTQSPGPLATPLSSSQKSRKSAILPQHKLNPSASTRLLTPQNRKIGGYGFTYSTYSTPNSASSASSPGYSSSLFSPGSLTRSLGKSLSTSNLRNSFTPETSILAPGAFSTTGRSFGGSMKKLSINRNINRVPLFDEPPSTTKRVSFAGPSNGAAVANGTNAAETNGITGGEIVLRDNSENVSPGEGSSRTSSTVNGDATAATPRRPEMEQVNGNDLTPVPELRALAPRTSSSSNVDSGMLPGDPVAGEYWSLPPLEDLKKMSRRELQEVPNFVVGRKKIGKIEFNFGRPVDLTGVDLDKLFGDIILLTHRHASVYGESCSVDKVPNGTGINVESRVILENSWPRRGKSLPVKDNGLLVKKHIERLKRVGGTNIERYIAETGEWIFTVPHFSSYGFNYDDFSDEDDEESSELSSIPDSPAQHPSVQIAGTPQRGSFASPTQSQSSPDDTFDFKKVKRKRVSVPGGFGDDAVYEEDVEEGMNAASESFLGERSVDSLDGQHDADFSKESEARLVVDQDMADPLSAPVQTTEPHTAKESEPFKDSIKPKSILKPQSSRPAFGTPSKGQLVFDDDWANLLQRTISPKKQDRQALRENQGNVLRRQNGTSAGPGQPPNGSIIMTRMDLMESLFGRTDRQDLTVMRTDHGIELPYPKRPKTSQDLDILNESEKQFHSCNKPHFSDTGVLVYANKGPINLEDGIFATVQAPIVGASKDIRFLKLPTFSDAVPSTLDAQRNQTMITTSSGVSAAQLIVDPPFDFADIAKSVDVSNARGIHEQQAWQLLSILFDETDQAPSDMTDALFQQHKERYRKDKLSEFWESLVYADTQQHAQRAGTAEEKAIAYLSGHNVADACLALLVGQDLRLATMLSQIGGDLMMRRDIVSQIEEWRRMDALSEMNDSVRALYELLAGNCAQAEGKIGDGRENKATSFNIAGRFRLDWRRAFGLRLWYGTLVDEPIELAVAQFADALRDNLEDVKPVPWFIEQGVDMGWSDPEKENREDILWGILKLYASSKLDIPANTEDILAPENVSGHPLDARLSFQLFQLFKSRQNDPDELDERKVGMPTVRASDGVRGSLLSSTTSQTENDEQAEDPLVELGDKLTLTYAASLHTAQHWTTAVFIYTHLSSSELREHYIRTLLAQFSNTYTVHEHDPTYQYLNTLQIPVEWMHAAAALLAKTEGDHIREVMHLVSAHCLEEAHEVLCRSVGPKAIISRDFDSLRELLGPFLEQTPPNTPDRNAIGTHSQSKKESEPVLGWSTGGQIYFDYIHLLDLTNRPADEGTRKELLYRLQKALEAVAGVRWNERGLNERVALMEIAGVVASFIAKSKPSERARVLKLPLTEDLWLRHSTELSVNYYRAIMASAK
ncbi:hypothetical protein CC78DRAFT_616586 [Lojkania enalia]|uniref:Peptidase S59 domain-containing protein n=1 Tax=Lojkania enalia TaxID=147567 RepID=A0A9P4K9P0_9PLEO|nr:hypothetical protein CC78DRAFT_616586 [Didymosphaeria enalia]